MAQRVTEVPSVRGATEISLLILLAIYIQSVHTKESLEICTLYLRRSLCHRHLRDIAFISVLSVALCALFILSVLVYHSIFRMSQKKL